MLRMLDGRLGSLGRYVSQTEEPQINCLDPHSKYCKIGAWKAPWVDPQKTWSLWTAALITLRRPASLYT